MKGDFLQLRQKLVGQVEVFFCWYLSESSSYAMKYEVMCFWLLRHCQGSKFWVINWQKGTKHTDERRFLLLLEHILRLIMVKC